METKQCIKCNKEFPKIPLRSKKSWALAKYCSIRCRSIISVEQLEKVCFTCKSLYQKPKNQGGKIWLSRKYCSIKCRPLANLGRKSPWTTERNLQDNPKRRREQHWNWNTDRTKIVIVGDNIERRSVQYTQWRKSVWQRDNWKCKIANEDCKGRIEAHHILGFTEYPELRYEINNGITLCHFHHPRKRKDEINLSPYFRELVMNTI